MNASQSSRLRMAAAAGILAALGTGALAAKALADAPIGASTVVTAPFTTETWYQPAPACSSPVGCLPVTPPAQNPYGANTLHVADSAGNTTASSYLGLGQVSVPDGAQLTAATLTIPLDVSTNGNGSLQPDTAHVQVCTATGTLDSAEGSFAQPPPTSCTNSAPMKFQSDAASPTLTADLTPLLPALSAGLSGSNFSLAILPAQPAQTDAWHIVFSDSQRQPAPSAPPKLSLTFSSVNGAPPDVTTDAPSPSASATKASATAPTRTVAAAVPIASSAAPASAPAVPAAIGAPAAPATVPTVQAPAVAPAASAAAAAPVAQVPAAQTITTGFAYPAVLLLPLAFGLGGFAIVRMMTRDLTPRQRGAASR